MTCSNHFPYVAPEWLVHQTPHNAQIKLRHAAEDPSQRGLWHVSPLAFETLKLCTGERTLGQVLLEVNARFRGDGFSAVESAAAFLTDAVKLGVLVFQERPEPRPVDITGSADAYYPLHLALELTDYCNLRCGHCYREASDEGRTFLPTEKLLQVLSEARKKGVHSLELSGGEPTLHPDFGRILEFCLKTFGAISLLTNGTTRLADRYLPLLTEFKDKLMVQVDLDGCCASEHDALRGKPGCFDLSVEAIRKLTAQGIRVRAAMVIYPGNVESIEKTYALARELGVRWFSASPAIQIGRAAPNLFLTRPQLEDAIGRLNSLAESDPEMIATVDELKRTAGMPGMNCGAGSRALTVGPDGQLRPCFLVNRHIPAFANILKCSTEEALISGPLSFFHELDPPGPEVCGQCPFSGFCNACVARPLLAWERMRETDPSFVCAWSERTGFAKRLGLES
jgi:radical SAM protein with 4Fe4S-binding SPASM domain